MEETTEDYAEFEKRVKRTIYIDNLSPSATDVVLKTALDQHGDVLKVEFIPNYIYPPELPRATLVELRTEKQATEIIEMLNNYPFMICGNPRPIRASAAEAGMFADRPRKPGKSITIRWLKPEDPDFVVANKIKELTVKNAAEAEFFLKDQMEEEKKLAKKQSETLKAQYKKFELVDGVFGDASAYRLAEGYGMSIKDT